MRKQTLAAAVVARMDQPHGRTYSQRERLQLMQAITSPRAVLPNGTPLLRKLALIQGIDPVATR